MANQRAFDFRSAEPMAGDVQNIIDSADDPKISILIATRAITRKVVPFELLPVLLFVALLVAVNGAQHRRPWTSNDQFPANVRSDFTSFFIDNCRVDPQKPQGSDAWFCR